MKTMPNKRLVVKICTNWDRLRIRYCLHASIHEPTINCDIRCLRCNAKPGKNNGERACKTLYANLVDGDYHLIGEDK